MKARFALLLVFLIGCGSTPFAGPNDGGRIVFDAGVLDAGVPGAGGPDAGGPNAGVPDAGGLDAGVPDAGVPDAGGPNAGVPDAGGLDAGVPDAGVPDAGGLDAGGPDAGVPDAGVPDAGGLDAGVPDAGVPDAGPLYDATLLESTLPARIPPGASLTVGLTLRNAGTGAWAASTFAFASMNEPAPLWGPISAPLATDVPPGASVRFELAITAPSVPGLYRFRWRMSGPPGAFGATVDLPVEITCDDGVFCNGIERWAGGVCVPGPDPCDDGVACTSDACDEGRKTCRHTPSGCPDCRACVPSCSGRTCGDDGCGGSCGTCTQTGTTCVDGVCKVPMGPGSCAMPLPIEPVGTQVLTGDTTRGASLLTPTCEVQSPAPEIAFTFTLQEATVVDARVVGFDTVLSLRTECDRRASTVACNDDSTPPGWPGSRIVRALQPGTYFLIVDGYSETARGAFTLAVLFLPGTCVPQCDGRYCGPDGCGGSCGTCVTGSCGADGHCADPCARACEGKQCGDNGCGGSCGACGTGQVCTGGGLCVPGALCDHERPACSPACAPDEFCGTDCVCRKVNAPLPDLAVDATALASSLATEVRFFRDDACALVEQCVGAAGWRKLLRFEVRTPNLGQVDLELGAPSAHPALYVWSPCHRHFHFDGYASYELRDETGAVVVAGRKQAFCLQDLVRVVDSPAVMCEARYTCSFQGIQRGWADVYRSSLDCQWLDITDVPPGRYRLHVRVNPNRVIQEVTLDNNEASVDVTIR